MRGELTDQSFPISLPCSFLGAGCAQSCNLVGEAPDVSKTHFSSPCLPLAIMELCYRVTSCLDSPPFPLPFTTRLSLLFILTQLLHFWDIRAQTLNFPYSSLLLVTFSQRCLRTLIVPCIVMGHFEVYLFSFSSKSGGYREIIHPHFTP